MERIDINKFTIFTCFEYACCIIVPLARRVSLRLEGNDPSPFDRHTINLFQSSFFFEHCVRRGSIEVRVLAACQRDVPCPINRRLSRDSGKSGQVCLSNLFLGEEMEEKSSVMAISRIQIQRNRDFTPLNFPILQREVL